MYEGQTIPPALSSSRIQAVAGTLVSGDYRIKRIVLLNESGSPRRFYSSDEVIEIRLLPTRESLKEMKIFFAVEDRSVLIITGSEDGYAFAKDLCDRLYEQPSGLLSSLILKMNADFLR